MENKTFTEAEKFYNENKDRLVETLLSENEGQIDDQPENDQVAVWFDSFSLCYQNSDMNGGGKGEPHWNNAGADSGLDDLLEILKKDERFQPLIAKDEYWKNEYLRQIIQDFCAEYAERHEIAGYFECNQ